MVEPLFSHPTPDCVIVGGGPAGLTAAIYLARFHLEVRVIDNGKSRAASIPCTHNHAGFPDGISGAELLKRMQDQAKRFGVRLYGGQVTRLDTVDELIEVVWSEGPVRARSVLLATGVANHRPSIDETVHQTALSQGLIRYCPICDGYEVTDKRVAVIGTGDRGRNEAVFLRGFTKEVTLIAADGPHDLNADDEAALRAIDIELVAGPTRVTGTRDGKILIETGQGRKSFDTLYPALGSDIHNVLAKAMGAKVSETGCLIVDAHQRTSIPGLYAAGDVVLGLDQISHAMGEGGVAATTIRNDLAQKRQFLR